MAAAPRDVFEASRPEPIERLARIEGESNFYSLLAGIEIGKDTTEDMAALAFTRRLHGCVPEVLETFVAQTGIWRRPLMAAVFNAICDELHPKPKDKPWMRGAVADAYLLVRHGYCKPSKLRARKFRVRRDDYLVIRKLAYCVLLVEVDRATQAFERSTGRAGDRNHQKNVR